MPDRGKGYYFLMDERKLMGLKAAPSGPIISKR
jgi:hypothetical protein